VALGRKKGQRLMFLDFDENMHMQIEVLRAFLERYDGNQRFANEIGGAYRARKLVAFAKWQINSLEQLLTKRVGDES
jgi:hypothetical protein